MKLLVTVFALVLTISHTQAGTIKVGYFGIFTSPNLENWNSANGAASPETGNASTKCNKNCDTYAMNLWNQISLTYPISKKVSLVVAPRFFMMLAHPRDNQGSSVNRSMFQLDDALVGLPITIKTGRFKWFMRPAVRLPTSYVSRHSDNAGFGKITYQFELNNSFQFDLNPKYSLSFFMQNRHWVYENKYNFSRHRLYVSPGFTYNIDDQLRFQAYYELIYENNKRHRSINGKGTLFQDYNQDVLLGLSKDLTPALNVFPYLGAFVNDVPFSTRSLWIGAWVNYSFN